MIKPMRTYQIFIAPTDSVVDTYDDPRYEAQVIVDPYQIITVPALSESTIVAPEGYTLLGSLEVVPQDFEVGDTVYMDWFYMEWSPLATPWNLLDKTIRVRSIAGWDREVSVAPDQREVDNIGWHEPQPIAGVREYLVTLPEGFTGTTRTVASKVGATGGSITWESKSTTVTVVEVLN